VKGIQNPFFAPVVELMQTAIEQTKYIPVVHYIDESSDEVGVASQLLTEKKALGIVFLGGNPASKVRSLSKFRVPCVLSTMPPGNHEIKNVSSVCIDDNIAAKSAVDYLLSKGHKKIAVLGGRRMDRDLVWNRYLGAKSAIEEQGYVFDEDLYLESKFSLDDSYKAVKSALKEYPGGFTAIFAMSDIMALGAMKAIFDSGSSVPRDISVIGFDGIKIAGFYHPSLTTVRQPYEEIAAKSIELLVSNIEGATEGRNITLETRIIEGESVFDINK
jgi:LacI family transcriptional regulator